MLEVINPALKRELHIIQYLYKKKKRLTVEELRELVHVTEKTIRSDIDRININFPALCIEVYPKGQIEMICPDNVGMGYVYRRIMHLSLETVIFEDVLNNPNQSIKQISENFFISESLFRKIIHKWNRVFKKKKLKVSIAISPAVAIEGDEMTIRQLYYHCLAEKYIGDLQGNFLNEGNSVWELIARLGEIFSIGMSYSGHLKLAYWFFVSFQRIKQGYFIEKEHTKAGKEIAQLLYSKVSSDTVFMEQFAQEYQLRLSVESLLDILGRHDWELLMTKRLTKEISSYEQKETGLSMIAVKDFLLSLYESIHYENPHLEQTFVFVYTFLTLQYQLPCFFYDSYRDFREYVKEESPYFLEMFEMHLEKSALPDYLKQREELKNEFLYYVVIHTESLLEKLSRVGNQKKILILTTFHQSYMHALKKKTEDRFEESVSVSIHHSSQSQLSLVHLKKFDIILTNYVHLSSELDSRIIYVDIGVPMDFLEKVEKRLR